MSRGWRLRERLVGVDEMAQSDIPRIEAWTFALVAVLLAVMVVVILVLLLISIIWPAGMYTL